MERCLKFLFLFAFCGLGLEPAFADKDFYFDFRSDELNLTGINNVFDGVSVVANRINVEDSTFIQNFGQIEAEIFIPDNANLIIQNSGTMNSTFIAGDGATITQIIKSRDDINNIGFGGDLQLQVSDIDSIRMSDILMLGADKVSLDNVGLVLDSVRYRMMIKPVSEFSLGGNIVLYINSLDRLNKPLLENVKLNASNIFVHLDDLERIFSIKTFIQDGDLYAKVVRETDYYKIFQNSVGTFLNEQRTKNKNSGLLYALDTAESLADMNCIMNNSVAFNPKLLLRVVHTISDLNNISGFNYSGLTAGADVVLSDDFYSYGGEFSVASKILKNGKFQLGAFGSKLVFSDNLDDFSADIVGLKSRFLYDVFDSVFLDMKANFSAFFFDTDEIFYNDKVQEDPVAFDLLVSPALGFKVFQNDSFYVNALTGINVNYDNLLDMQNWLYDGRFGFDLGMLDTVDDNLLYRYNLSSFMDVSGDFSVKAGFGFISVADGAGAEINLTALNDELGWSGKLSFNVNIAF